MKWYEKAIPKVRDVIPHITDMCKKIAKSSHVKNIYIFNTLYENLNNPEYRIKDIDLLIDCKFDSGDLLAIDNTNNGALKMSHNLLTEWGYNPDTVNFTKTILEHKVPSLDFWAISNDKKLLHWGPISETLEEWKQIKKEAEHKTCTQTGFENNQFHLISENDRKKWHQFYENNIKEFYEGCPHGWYASQNKTDKILQHTHKVV